MANVYSANLDGNDAYSIVNHADLRPTGAFTVGGWIKGSSVAATQSIISSFNYSASKFAGIQLRLDSGKASLYSFRNTGITPGTDYQVITGGTSVNDGVWHWIVGVWDTTKLYIYVDGSSNATAVNWTNAPGYQATNYVQIGYEDDDTNAAGQYFIGNIDEIFIVNGTAWDATKITAMYQKFLTGETNLKAYYQLENNTDDSSGNSHTLTAISDPAYQNDVPFPGSSVKKMAGVAYASIKKISGVAIASVKKVGGLA